jgi:hypothetical protein
MRVLTHGHRPDVVDIDSIITEVAAQGGFTYDTGHLPSG